MSLHDELSVMMKSAPHLEAICYDESHAEHDCRNPVVRIEDVEALLARHPEQVRCNCGFGGFHEEGNPLCDRNAQPQAPVGDGLENGVSDGEREGLGDVVDAVNREWDPNDTTHPDYPYALADALLAAGYRKPTLPSVEDMAKVILEAWCWDGDGEQPAPEVRAAIAIKSHLLDGGE